MAAIHPKWLYRRNGVSTINKVATTNQTMKQKTEQIKRLADHFLNKYGSTNIIVTDYWDGDDTAIGFADKTKQYAIYVTDKGKNDNKFFVSLENSPSSDKFPYSPSGDFDNLSADEVEEILIKHLRI